MKLTLDTETIRLITFFENMTRTTIRDCIIDESSNTVFFVVENGKIGIAIGKNGNSVKNAERLIGKNIKLFEFSEDICTFVKRVIPQANSIKIRNDRKKRIVEVKVDNREKAFVIGRGGRNLKLYRELLKRNHHVDDLIIK